MRTLINACLQCAVAVVLAACASNGSPDVPAYTGKVSNSSSGSNGSNGASSSSGSGGDGTSLGGTSSGGTSSGGTSSGGTSSGGTSSGGTSSGGTSSGAGDDGGTSSGAGDDGATPPPATNCFPAQSDFTAAGPYTATSMDIASVQCTIYQPTMLAPNGCLNPVVVWGNGTLNSPSSYDALFKHFASQGFIIIAADTSNAGSGMEMLACLNYILMQATTSGSAFYNKIDTKHIASSGYSQGGAGCLAAGEDPRFTTVLAVSPYVVISLGSYDPSMDAAKQIHPLFMISGSSDSVATPNNNQQPIFDQAPVPLFWGTHNLSTHFEVLGAGGAYAGPMTAWFRWKLMGDPAARDWFEKPACKMCSMSDWMIQTNKDWM